MDHISYFAVAIISGWVLGASYMVAAFMVAVGFRISRPTVGSGLFHTIQYLFGLTFFGMSLHYFHLGYHGAVHGILPSQESFIAATANVVQLITLPTVLLIALYIRFISASTDDT